MIDARNLKKIYQMGANKVHALDGVSIRVPRNQFVAIMGPSGSGKTTLMNVLGCLDRPTLGRYRLDGREVSSLEDRDMAALRNTKIGFVFQTFHLLPRLTALRNVMLPLQYARWKKNEARQRAIHVLDLVGLADRLLHRPSELSGGQCQRVAIARAIVNKPCVVFADEPTGNLDSKTSSEIMALFQELHEEGETLLLVTHEPEIAAASQRVIHMRDGRIQDEEYAF